MPELAEEAPPETARTEKAIEEGGDVPVVEQEGGEEGAPATEGSDEKEAEQKEGEEGAVAEEGKTAEPEVVAGVCEIYTCVIYTCIQYLT